MVIDYDGNCRLEIYESNGDIMQLSSIAGNAVYGKVEVNGRFADEPLKGITASTAIYGNFNIIPLMDIFFRPDDKKHVIIAQTAEIAKTIRKSLDEAVESISQKALQISSTETMS